jgi:hypothetical protein
VSLRCTTDAAVRTGQDTCIYMERPEDSDAESPHNSLCRVELMAFILGVQHSLKQSYLKAIHQIGVVCVGRVEWIPKSTPASAQTQVRVLLDPC